MWYAPPEPARQRYWLSSQTSTLLNHLRNCEDSPTTAREQAAEKLAGSRASSVDSLTPSSRSASLATTPPPSFPALELSSLTDQSPLLFTPNLTSTSQQLPLRAMDIDSPPSSSAGRSQAIFNVAQPAPRQRRIVAPASPLLQNSFWTDQLQKQLETGLARITASANLPFSWTEDPEVRAFLARFFPAARPISRYVLTSRLIPAELRAQRSMLLPQIRNGEATMQCDGWSGGNFHHYTGFTMTVKGEVRLLLSSPI